MPSEGTGVKRLKLKLKSPAIVLKPQRRPMIND